MYKNTMGWAHTDRREKSKAYKISVGKILKNRFGDKRIILRFTKTR
jgi:hypothetical protein